MTHPAPLDAEALRRLTLPSDPWLSCDACFDLVDVVVDRLLAGTAAMSEAFRVHLLACDVCREEAASLATLVAADHGLTPEAAAATIDDALRPGGRTDG